METEFEEMKIKRLHRSPVRPITFFVDEANHVDIIALPETTAEEMESFIDNLKQYFTFSGYCVHWQQIRIPQQV